MNNKSKKIKKSFIVISIILIIALFYGYKQYEVLEKINMVYFEMPINLDSGEVIQGEFKTSYNSWYSLELETDIKQPYLVQRDMLVGDNSKESNFEIKWEVQNPDIKITGSSVTEDGCYFNKRWDSISKTIGFFELPYEKNIKVKAEVVKGHEKLNECNPRIKIFLRIRNKPLKDMTANAQLNLSFTCLVVAVLFLLLVIDLFRILMRKGRHNKKVNLT